jgi:hypothetical protein
MLEDHSNGLIGGDVEGRLVTVSFNDAVSNTHIKLIVVLCLNMNTIKQWLTLEQRRLCMIKMIVKSADRALTTVNFLYSLTDHPDELYIKIEHHNAKDYGRCGSIAPHILDGGSSAALPFGNDSRYPLNTSL